MKSVLGVGTEFALSRYGGRRQLLRFYYSRILDLVGVYPSVDLLSLQDVDRLVFICAGNICRSPFAEVVAEKVGIQAVSCGLATRGGDLADSRALEVSSNLGYDMTGHTSQQFSSQCLRSTDLLLCMEPSHLVSIDAQIGESVSAQIALLGSYHTPAYPYIPDPYGKPAEYFQRCFKWIEQSVRHVASRLDELADS